MTQAAALSKADGRSLATAAVVNSWSCRGWWSSELPTLGWLLTLSRVPLSIAYPFNALGYLGILAASVLVRHERANVWTVLGSAMVVSGLIIGRHHEPDSKATDVPGSGPRQRRAGRSAARSTRIYSDVDRGPTSDDFFARADPIVSGGDRRLAFIDGMHLKLEFALRDFINLEKLTHPGSVVVFDDVLPRNNEEASRVRHSLFWAGDVYKVAVAPREVPAGFGPGSSSIRSDGPAPRRWAGPDEQSASGQLR